MFTGILNETEFNHERKFLKEFTTFSQESKAKPEYRHNGISIYKRLKLKYARLILHKQLQNLKNIDFEVVDRHLETLGIKPDVVSTLGRHEKIIAIYEKI
jgi:ABC-type long-subunit fatty acid transport system fused permease/ATPase subunit